MSAMKRIGCLIILSMLTMTCALAEFSPGYQQMKYAYDRGQRVECRLGVELEDMDDISEKALPVLVKWLKSLEGRVSCQVMPEGIFSTVEMVQNGESLLEIQTLETKDESYTVFPGQRNMYITGPNEKNPCELMGETTPVPDFLLFGEKLPDAMNQLYLILQENGAEMTEEKKATSIKNVGTSPKFSSCTLTADQLNQLKPDFEKVLRPLFHSLMLSEFSNPFDFEKLVFSSDGRFKRMYDGAGKDLGFQFTGQVQYFENQPVKVTIFGGCQKEEGFYYSLTLSNTKGKKVYQWNFGGDFQQKESVRVWNIALNQEDIRDEKNIKISAAGSLENHLTDTGENLDGKITCTVDENGRRKTITLKPEFTLNSEEILGKIHVTVKYKKKTLADFSLHCSLQKAENRVFPDLPVIDLRGLTPDSARQVLSKEQKLLYRAGFSLVFSLPEEERNQLTQALHTDEWMTAPSVSALEYYVQSDWIVEEERDR